MKKQILIFLLLLFATNKIIAQHKEFRDTEVDSITFLNNRKLLNDLSSNNFQKRIFTKNNIHIPYRLLLPKQNEPSKKFPLVITFHNSSRIGNDNESQLEPLARIWLRDEIYNKYPCYVLAPQFDKRSSNYLSNADSILAAKPADNVFVLLKLIKSIQKEYPNMDTKRIYLVGYSMGASTAQNLMSISPNKFAALVSIAAVPDFSNLKKINQKNIWLIHGEKDDENPYNGSAALYNKLVNNKNLTFTTFNKLNHNNITIPFLVTEEIPKWLFEN